MEGVTRKALSRPLVPDELRELAARRRYHGHKDDLCHAVRVAADEITQLRRVLAEIGQLATQETSVLKPGKS
jgi:hypothetical protein